MQTVVHFCIFICGLNWEGWAIFEAHCSYSDSDEYAKWSYTVTVSNLVFCFLPLNGKWMLILIIIMLRNITSNHVIEGVITVDPPVSCPCVRDISASRASIRAGCSEVKVYQCNNIQNTREKPVFNVYTSEKLQKYWHQHILKKSWLTSSEHIASIGRVLQNRACVDNTKVCFIWMIHICIVTIVNLSNTVIVKSTICPSEE